jgi:hypothetical protein
MAALTVMELRVLSVVLEDAAAVAVRERVRAGHAAHNGPAVVDLRQHGLRAQVKPQRQDALLYLPVSGIVSRAAHFRQSYSRAVFCACHGADARTLARPLHMAAAAKDWLTQRSQGWSSALDGAGTCTLPTRPC